MLYDQGKLMIAWGGSVSTSAGVSRFVHASTERGPATLETVAEVKGHKSSIIAGLEVENTNQTYILGEEQGGSLRSQLALRQDWRLEVQTIPSANYSYDTGYQRPAQPPSACEG